MAYNEDSARVEELASKQTGPGLDWSNIYPYWLVAEKEGKIIGCLNVAPSKPVGRLDFLSFDETLNPHTRSKAFRGLVLQGIATLMAGGSTASVSLVPFELRAYKKILKKHFNAIVIGQGNMIIKRL